MEECTCITHYNHSDRKNDGNYVKADRKDVPMFLGKLVTEKFEFDV